jgi:SAM-dependent methyltransferase
MTGTTIFWLCWAFEDYLNCRPQRVLSIGCGDGGRELLIARNQYAGQSMPSTSRRAASRTHSKLRNVNFYVESFEGFVAAPPTTMYDFIMFSGSLHHMRDLERHLQTARRILRREWHGTVQRICGSCLHDMSLVSGRRRQHHARRDCA